MKLINEMAMELAEKNYHGEQTIKTDIKHACQEMAVFMQRWIPVEEELPKYDVAVLMKSGSSVFVGFIFDGFFILKEVVDGCHKIINGVTHWRPIELK